MCEWLTAVERVCISILLPSTSNYIWGSHQQIRFWPRYFHGMGPNEVYFSTYCALRCTDSYIVVELVRFHWWRSFLFFIQKSHQQQIWLRHHCDTFSQPSDFSCWMPDSSWSRPNQENSECDPLVQIHSHAHQPRDHALTWWKKKSLVIFLSIWSW